MKILRIIARLNVGGPARHVVWLADRLKPFGYRTTLVAGTVPDGEEDMAYFATNNGVEPLYLREMSRELSAKDVVSLFKTYRILRRERPDVLHTHTAKAGTVGRIAAFVYKWLTLGTIIGNPRKLKVVHTFHGHVFHSYYGKQRTRIFLMIERALAAFATDRIVVISDQQLDEINRRFGVGRREKFAVVPLGMELEPFAAAEDKRRHARSIFNATDDHFVVGFSGRLTEIKDIPLLLSAAKVCIESAPEVNFRFVIIGDGSLRGELETFSEDLGISHAITFLGSRSDVADLLSGLDAFALTSKNEGTPLSLIEAMASGVPAVSTRVGGVRDLLGASTESNDGFEVCERGIAVDSREPEDFAKGLIYLAKNKTIQKRVSDEALVFVRDRYSIDRLVSDIDGLYRELTTRP